MKSKSGFTIVELLVVLVIIALLAAVMSVAYISIQAQSRDTKRSADAVTFVGALEAFYDKNGEYPAGCATSSNCTDYEPFYSFSTTVPHFNSQTTLTQVQQVLGANISDIGDPSATNSKNPSFTPFYDKNTAVERTRFDRYVYFGGAMSPKTNGSGGFGGGYSSDASFKCSFYFTSLSPANSNKVSSYFFAYYSELEKKWIIHKGKNGVAPYLSCAAGTTRLDTDPAS